MKNKTQVFHAKTLLKSTAFFFCMFLLCFAARAEKIIVCTGCTVKTIEAAVTIAKPFDTILVKQGNYTGLNIILNKPLVLLGENFPVVDGMFKNDVFTVQANHVAIKGFMIKNSGNSSIKDFAGIKISKVKYCTIENNRLLNTYFGIFIAGSSFCTVSGNIITGNAVSETSSGNGIHFWYCDSNYVIGNQIEKHRDGIYLEFAKNSRIINNTAVNNVRYGLHFMFSDGNIYQHNFFAQNNAGVAVMYSKNIKMYRNTFRNNWGNSAFGLLLKDITNSVIKDNVFEKNTVGIYMENSSRMNIEHNNFKNNGWALKILANCAEDTLYHNNFSGNSFDVSTNGSVSLNYFYNNYWDKYSGYDLNRDNIGDVPYRPVSFFAMIVEEIPFSVMLLRSFIVDLLDKAEKIMPAFIPESLIDKHPLMHKKVT